MAMVEPNHDGWRHEFRNFLQELEIKVEQGAVTYGDTSFDLPPDRLLHELQLEALDIAGWGYILWMRLQKMRDVVRERLPTDPV